MNLAILYRGLLASCNYDCSYCPFAKRTDSRAQLGRDRQGLARFVNWLLCQPQHRWKVLFTPWGEALVRPWYRQAVVALTRLEHVDSVAVQTNLSGDIDWLGECRVGRLALWASYHPTEASAEDFRGKVERLHARGVRLCVGMVGVPEFLDDIVDMRRRLPVDVYLWINAQQPRVRPYTPSEFAVLRAVDPLFAVTASRQPSLGRDCRAGEFSFTVDETGAMRRCHFVDDVIGNIHDAAWEEALRPRNCPQRFCDCFLGKAQLQADSLGAFFGDTLLERLPRQVWYTNQAASLPVPSRAKQ